MIHTVITCGMLLTSTACTSCTLAPVTNQPMCTKSVCYANKQMTFLGENFSPKIAHSFIMCICADASCACAAHTAWAVLLCVNHTGARTHFSYPEGCCSVHESTLCHDSHVLSKQHFVHGSTFARRHLLSKQYLRVASDRILCARRHLCSKARTVLAILNVRQQRTSF